MHGESVIVLQDAYNNMNLCCARMGKEKICFKANCNIAAHELGTNKLIDVPAGTYIRTGITSTARDKMLSAGPMSILKNHQETILVVKVKSRFRCAEAFERKSQTTVLAPSLK